MAQTFTSTAYSATPKHLHTGVNAVSFDYTTPAGVSLSASANSAVVFGPRIPNKAVILNVMGRHSSGATTCPVDIGVDNTISALASQRAQASTGTPTNLEVPYRISLSDDAASLFSTIKFGVTPSSDTAVVRLQYVITYAMDQTS
jgi:hypothetical protein